MVIIMVMCKKKKLCKMDHYKTRHYINLIPRVLLHRSERVNKMMPALLAVLATFCMIFICAVSYCSIRTSASSGFKYYTSLTVENGETLWDIADKYVDYDHYKNKNSYITEVQHINHLDENCSIDAGQILILPYYSNQYVK